MRKLYEQDIIEILYGATLLGAGGGGSLKQGLGMLDGLKKDGNAIEVDLLDLDEIGDNEYAAVVCGLGSPVAMLDPSKPAFGPDAVHAFKAFQKAFIAEGKEVKYLQSGEICANIWSLIRKYRRIRSLPVLPLSNVSMMKLWLRRMF